MDAQSEKSAPLAALRLRVMALTGWRRAAVAFLAGGLSALAYAPIFAAPVLFLTLPILVWLIDASPNWRRAASAGWLFGFGYFFFNLFWVGEAFLVEAEKFAWLMPFAVTLLPAGLALFWAAAAAVARLFWTEGIARLFVFAIVFAVLEWLRGHVLTGFPWNVVGYALTYPLPLMQSAALFGAYGLTAIALFVFPAPLVMLADHRRRPTGADVARAIALAAIPIAILFAYGAWRLGAPEAFVSGVKMRIVQPSVPQREKWRAEFQRKIFDDHVALSLANPQGKADSLAGITHLVWPEAAMPFFPLETPEALDVLATVIPPGTTLITGALRHDPNPTPGTAILPATRTLNSILVLDDQAKLVGAYDKIKLVPFGEYRALRCSPLGDWHPKAHPRTRLVCGRRFASPSLYRAWLAAGAWPRLLRSVVPGRDRARRGAPGVLINVTNDGWFGNTTGPYQHYYQSRVRAVEEGLPLIRAANNGISAVVDPYGRPLANAWVERARRDR